MEISKRYLCLVAVMLLFSNSGSANEAIKEFARAAAKECRAAKNLRRSDLDKAQQYYGEYQSLLQKIKITSPDIEKSKDKETQWVLNFCLNVGKDLSRAKALPIMEQGIEKCNMARALMADGRYAEALVKSKEYYRHKADALAVSSDLMEVYKNSYEMRLCESVKQDIETHQAAQQEEQQQIEQLIGQMQADTAACEKSLSTIKKVKKYSSKAISAAQQISKKITQAKRDIAKYKEQLEFSGIEINENVIQEYDALLSSIDKCKKQLATNISRVEKLKARNKKTVTPKPKTIVVKEPELLSNVVATYPKRAVDRDIQGYVKVQFTVTKAGKVENIKIIEAKPQGWFEDSVLEAVSKYQYKPKTENDQPVDAHGIEKKVFFKLRKKKSLLPKF